MARQDIDTWKLFLRAYVVVLEKLKQQMREEHDLPLTWFDVLVQLRLAGGRLRMTELASSVLLSTSGLTRLLDRIEEKGLIARQPCKGDRRGYWAVLTEEGRRVAKETWPAHAEGIRRHFLAHLDDKEIHSLRIAFSKILDAEDPHSVRERRVGSGSLGDRFSAVRDLGL